MNSASFDLSISALVLILVISSLPSQNQVVMQVIVNWANVSLTINFSVQREGFPVWTPLSLFTTEAIFAKLLLWILTGLNCKRKVSDCRNLSFFMKWWICWVPWLSLVQRTGLLSVFPSLKHSLEYLRWYLILQSGHLILRDGEISHNSPQITSDRTIWGKSHNS